MGPTIYRQQNLAFRSVTMGRGGWNKIVQNFSTSFMEEPLLQHFRDLQHETRIELCGIVCCRNEKYEVLYSVGHMANSSFDTKQ